MLYYIETKITTTFGFSNVNITQCYCKALYKLCEDTKNNYSAITETDQNLLQIRSTLNLLIQLDWTKLACFLEIWLLF